MVVDVPRTSKVATEEVFGPVAPIIPVANDADAVEPANAPDLGLTGYVFTRDLARELRRCEQLELGMIGLNRGSVSDPDAPFGGVKQSGLGREGGFEGEEGFESIDEYLETTYVAASW